MPGTSKVPGTLARLCWSGLKNRPSFLVGNPHATPGAGSATDILRFVQATLLRRREIKADSRITIHLHNEILRARSLR